MKNGILILLFALLPVGLIAQESPGLTITHGPWLQNVTTTGATVMWVTSRPAVPAILISDDGLEYELIQNSVDGMINAGDTLHKVRIDGLVPGKMYSYRVYSRSIDVFEPYKITYKDTLISASYNFQTVDPKASEVRFTVLNDVHGGTGKMAQYINNSGIENPDFYVFNGDMIDYFQSKDQIFKGFLDTAVFHFAKSVPFVYVRGNHEARGMYARYFKSFFDFAADRFYGSFMQGPVQFIVLDCGEDKPDDNQYYFQLADYDSYRFKQLEWLKNEIKTERFREAPFRIVIIHMPVIAGPNSGYGMSFLAEHFGPVLAGAGIDLMISGHTHKIASISAKDAGFGYPVIVSSNNSFIDVVVNSADIELVVRDVNGIEVLKEDVRKK